MLSNLFELLTYSALGASLVTHTMVLPEAAVVFTPTAEQLLTEESTELAVTLKANTPVESITGSLAYDPAVLSLTDINVADDFQMDTEAVREPGNVSFTVYPKESHTSVGIHAALHLTFFTTDPSTTTLSLADVDIRTPEGTPVNIHTRASTTLEVLERKNNLDLNADDAHTFADLRLFLGYLLTQNPSADFNNDARVGTKDLRILMRVH